MNIALPVILIVIANIVIYWLFFGNKNSKNLFEPELSKNSNEAIICKKEFEDKLEKGVNKNVR